MGKVTDILKKKTNKIVSVSPDTHVLDALKIMSEKNIGSILVMEDDTYLGIMTERDYARKVILKDKHSDEITVGEIMSTDLPRVNPRDTIEHCMKVMADSNVRYLPVFDNGVLTGIVSIIDVIQATVEVQKETIDSLQNFISSNYG
jgi:CBS domain-containing protein